jgi:hypothetical protein
MAEITEEMIEQELWKMAQERGLSATPMSRLEALRTLIDFRRKRADKP